MIRVFVKCTQSFSVHDNYVYWVSIGSLPIYWFGPHPNTLGARIDGGAHSETITPIQEHSIQQIALARPIHACDGDNADWSSET